MKKRFFVMAAVFVMAMALLAGCKSQEKENVNLDELGEKLFTEITYEDTMEPVGEDALYRVYEVDPEDVVKAVAYQSTGFTAEEIALWECKDADSAQRVYEAMEERVAQQKESFTDYNPNEIPKLENPVLIKSGNYVFLCLSNDNAKAEELIGE